nr:SIR2 family protein [uncultured Janthinobacterium sp.]
MILTRSDYFKIKKDHGQFYNVLDSLLTVNTVIFLGCSMTDPDIQLVLENTNVSAPSDHKHYAVLPTGRHPALLKAMENSYNIKAIQYDYDADGGHSILLESLRDLKVRIDDLRQLIH